jgi:hypothetical protein
VASHEIGTLDVASLEHFQTELIKAGFEPDPSDPRRWVGPIAESLRGLTDANTMLIRFVDGWPFQHPRLYVEGVDERHVSAGGEVCLWRSGAVSDAWLTLDGYMARIDEWVRRAREGFHPEDFALDAHLSFGRVRPDSLATVNISKLRLDGARGKHGVISGTWKDKVPVLEIEAGGAARIEGRWYYVGEVKAPPRDLIGVRALLSQSQRNNFDRRFRNVRKDGTPRLFLVAWDRELGREALVLLAERRDAKVVAEAIEVAPTDPDVLRLRAGPDVALLDAKSALMFGVGAVGSRLALLLAQSGLGRLVIVDGELLRPGDVVRHAAASWFVGQTKVDAVDLLAFSYAPWARVKKVAGVTWDPDEIRKQLADVDLVIDATGSASFTNMLSVLCEEEEAPLLSVALYRGGSVGRVRRQGQGDTAITARADEERYPVIPPAEEPLVFEAGCSSAVNDASPIAVTAIAALAAEAAVDQLTGRNLYPDEVIDTYRPLAEPPFDKIGRIPT